ncbi:MarR family winged helix-turn-helix transcriptional regulator [Desulfovibrio sp. OttesenSCG-928-F07]|nr:MarR family winged helix-turn-helix transcriptional regulator [Desulfovibrio sp. OttesenSCG-928-F07]
MKPHDYIPLTPCICISLRRLSQKATDVYDQALKPLGISVNQYSLLVSIARLEGCGTGQLARYIKQDKSTLVRTLPPLLRDGLIVDKSTDENRKRRLYITPAGESVLEKAFPVWEKAQKDIAIELGVDYDELMSFLEKLNLWK